MGQKAFTQESVAIWQSQNSVFDIPQIVWLERFTCCEKPRINPDDNLHVRQQKEIVFLMSPCLVSLAGILQEFLSTSVSYPSE